MMKLSVSSRATEEKYLLALGQIIGMDHNSLAALMDAYGSAEEAWHDSRHWLDVLALSEEKILGFVHQQKKLDPDAIYRYGEQFGVKITLTSDDDFPSFLRHVAEPPYFLYYLGTLPNPDNLAIAVVGSRRCTDYGRMATNRIVTDLVEKAGIHVVNGMAEGIDGVALKSALRAGGFCSAVLGCGIDVVYPAFHRKLYEALKEQGCIFSEFPFGTPGLKHNFPYRNRLISGLSHGILVPEAGRRSGTLHTVRHGLDQGKNIYAMPGSIFSKMSELPHYLIESGQAKFAACAEDILEDYIDLDLVERMYRSNEIDAFQFATNDGERKVLLELQHGRRTFDELIAASSLTASQLTSFLTRLEIEDAISEAPGNTYMLTNQ